MTSKPIANVMGILKLFENDTSNVFLGRHLGFSVDRVYKNTDLGLF